jgi:putative membrane protein
MTKFFMRWVVNAIALYLAIFLLDGRGLTFTGDWLSIVWLALIFGFTLLINTFLFWLTGEIGQAFNLGLSVEGFLPAFLGGLIVSVVSIVLSLFLRDDKRVRKG